MESNAIRFHFHATTESIQLRNEQDEETIPVDYKSSRLKETIPLFPLFID